jgi:hypothetical protein
MEKREIRSDFKFDSESRTVEGYAAVFESPSEYIGWTEVIHRNAITDDTIKNSDIFAKFNHADDKVLATTPPTLSTNNFIYMIITLMRLYMSQMNLWRHIRQQPAGVHWQVEYIL